MLVHMRAQPVLLMTWLNLLGTFAGQQGMRACIYCDMGVGVWMTTSRHTSQALEVTHRADPCTDDRCEDEISIRQQRWNVHETHPGKSL